jgi:kynureninase
MFTTDPQLAAQLDADDELAAFRAEFVIAEPDTIYLDGNSLGRLPKGSTAALHELIEKQWGERLIRSWNEGWFTAAGASATKSPG